MNCHNCDASRDDAPFCWKCGAENEQPSIEGPFGNFCNELDALIHKWRCKPLDDGLTGAEFVGALETAKHKILDDILEAAE